MTRHGHTTPSPAELVGVWRLEEYLNLDDDGRGYEGPLGPHPRGLLIYGADGYMSVSMMRSPQPASGNHAATGSGEVFMGYAGRWRLSDGNRVVHEVEVSAHPVMVGTEQVREVELDGDRLSLYGNAVLSDRPVRRVLRWRRASGEPQPTGGREGAHADRRG